MVEEDLPYRDRMRGLLLGTAVGDALGLPAGVGFATLRSVIKLWLGFPAHRSGVYSAGNGPAMRAPAIGAYFASRPAEMRCYLEAATRITHSDPRALTGASAVAGLTALSLGTEAGERPSLHEVVGLLRSSGPEDAEWIGWLDTMQAAHEADRSVDAFVRERGLGSGVSGYVYHTVPVAAYAWYRHFGDFRKTLGSVIRCGGDSDTVGAIAGAMAGAAVGESGIPGPWVRGIVEWPRSTEVLRRVADRLAEGSRRSTPTHPVPYPWAGIPLRNLVFLTLVLIHGFRRLAPPY